MTKSTTSEKANSETPVAKRELSDEQLSAIAGGVVNMPPVSAGGGKGTTPPTIIGNGGPPGPKV
jgi:hypothetical protein